MEDARTASEEDAWRQWPRYIAAGSGLRSYWYPVLPAGHLRSRPRSARVCNEPIVLIRAAGRVYALADRCPRHGTPLSSGSQGAPGKRTCGHGGCTIEVATGRIMSVQQHEPSVGDESGAQRVKCYPVEERAAMVWVYVGEEPHPPVEADIPGELLAHNAVIEPIIEKRSGNWRYAVENAVDEGHAKYLHRGSLWAYFSQFPAWNRGVRMVPSEDDQWLMRIRGDSVQRDVYPRLGAWPPPKPGWRSWNRGPSSQLAVRLPCTTRVVQNGWTDYEIFVPLDSTHHLAVFLAVRWTSGADALLWRLRARTYIRSIYYGLLNHAQDQWMISLMTIPPERLYRPDASITGWRKWVEEHARGVPAPTETAPGVGEAA